jgi:hypothetical protein
MKQGQPDLCLACGQVAKVHTWRDGWDGSLYEEKCEECYFNAHPEETEDEDGEGNAVEELEDEDEDEYKSQSKGVPTGLQVGDFVKVVVDTNKSSDKGKFGGVQAMRNGYVEILGVDNDVNKMSHANKRKHQLEHVSLVDVRRLQLKMPRKTKGPEKQAAKKQNELRRDVSAQPDNRRYTRREVAVAAKEEHGEEAGTGQDETGTGEDEAGRQSPWSTKELEQLRALMSVKPIDGAESLPRSFSKEAAEQLVTGRTGVAVAQKAAQLRHEEGESEEGGKEEKENEYEESEEEESQTEESEEEDDEEEDDEEESEEEDGGEKDVDITTRILSRKGTTVQRAEASCTRLLKISPTGARSLSSKCMHNAHARHTESGSDKHAGPQPRTPSTWMGSQSRSTASRSPWCGCLGDLLRLGSPGSVLGTFHTAQCTHHACC